MTTGSNVIAEIQMSSIPILTEARRLAEMGIVPGGTINNLEYVRPYISFDRNISNVDQLLLADAQTSGGLLICLPESVADNFLNRLSSMGVNAARIGIVEKKGDGRIFVD